MGIWAMTVHINTRVCLYLRPLRVIFPGISVRVMGKVYFILE